MNGGYFIIPDYVLSLTMINNKVEKIMHDNEICKMMFDNKKPMVGNFKITFEDSNDYMEGYLLFNRVLVNSEQNVEGHDLIESTVNYIASFRAGYMSIVISESGGTYNALIKMELQVVNMVAAGGLS